MQGGLTKYEQVEIILLRGQYELAVVMKNSHGLTVPTITMENEAGEVELSPQEARVIGRKLMQQYGDDAGLITAAAVSSVSNDNGGVY